MFIKKNQTEKFSIDGGTNGYLYPNHPKGEQTVAFVEMDGVYPLKGYSLNDVCTETIFVVEGSLEVEIEGQKEILKPGDMVMILPGNKYRVEGKGKSVDLITPAWDKKQNHILI